MNDTNLLELLLECKTETQATTLILFEVLRSRAMDLIALRMPAKTLSESERMALDVQCILEARELAKETRRKKSG